MHSPDLRCAQLRSAALSLAVLALAACATDAPVSPARTGSASGSVADRQRTTSRTIETVTTASSAVVDVAVVGNARACFGDGCTPGESATATIGGLQLMYGSSPTTDFTGLTLNGMVSIAQYTGIGTGNFGQIVTLGSSPTPISTSFTLELALLFPAETTLTVTGTISGSAATPSTGGFVLDFGGKKTPSAGVVTKVPFSLPATQGTVTLTVLPATAPLNVTFQITGIVTIDK